MHQFSDSSINARQASEAQIRFRMDERAFAPGTPAYEFFELDKRVSRTRESNHFHARFAVPGLATLPLQDFSFHFTESGGYIRSHPEGHWPQIKIEIAFNSPNESTLVNFQIDTGDDTVDAGLLFTRLNFALYTAHKCFLKGDNGETIIGFGIDNISPTMEEELLFNAKLFRKLKFIESVFDTKFVLPPIYSNDDLQIVEIVFRGITEGEFSRRGTAISFENFKPSDDELNSPPFTEPGPISHTFAQNLIIFDRVLRHDQVGPVSIHLDQTVVANSRVVDKVRAGESVPHIRFIVFDHQIRYRFEKYATPSPQTRRLKLEQFKKRLLAKEPEALVSLLEEPLASDVSADEARKIVNGWLQFNMFPDRYCPQEPSLENDRWRVPVWVTALRGQGGWVQDVFVDLKTGVISTPISAQEMRTLGKSVAAESFRAS